MFIVRVFSGGEGNLSARDTRYATKRQALEAISRLNVASIRRFDKTWCIMLKPR